MKLAVGYYMTSKQQTSAFVKTIQTNIELWICLKYHKKALESILKERTEEIETKQSQTTKFNSISDFDELKKVEANEVHLVYLEFSKKIWKWNFSLSESSTFHIQHDFIIKVSHSWRDLHSTESQVLIKPQNDICMTETRKRKLTR